MKLQVLASIFVFLSCFAHAADFELRSNSFQPGHAIPKLYTCDGENLSPELHWTPVPPNTESLVLMLTSPDWTTGLIYKWVVFNLPKDLKSLPQGADKALPEGSVSGANLSGDIVYRGPCAPDNKLHKYVFTLYALDKSLDLADGTDPEEVMVKMQNHILKQAQVVGTYQH